MMTMSCCRCCRRRRLAGRHPPALLPLPCCCTFSPTRGFTCLQAHTHSPVHPHIGRPSPLQHHLQIPFVKRAPMVTFKKPIGSISVSGHKFVGSPVPCGVVMTRLR